MSTMNQPNPALQAAIVARNVVKNYQSNGAAVQALRGADLEVSRGAFMAVMGPSGCGKSTLLHILGGLDRLDAGELVLDGERVDGLGEAGWARLRRRKIGYVFQFFNLIPSLTVADNIELPALMAGIKAGEAAERRERLLSDLGLTLTAKKAPGSLSGGEQQRVALARALINQPSILLADEPTGNLDSVATGEVLELLARYNDAGQTIVMVTHDPRVASVADRVVRMRDGRVIDETTLGDRDPRQALRGLVSLEA